MEKPYTTTSSFEHYSPWELESYSLKPYLQHNDTTSPHILAALAMLKPKVLKQLHEIEKNIQVLDIVLGALRGRREDLKGFLAGLDSIIAPIRRLPDDVLEEIFIRCLPTTRNAAPFSSESPLLLTLVCKKWRRITLAAPYLWTTLHIPVFFQYYSPTQAIQTPEPAQTLFAKVKPWVVISPARMSVHELQTARQVGLEQWLRRSGTLPLSISLHPASSPPSFTTTETQAAAEEVTEHTLNLIARYADRISTLNATAPVAIMDKLGTAITRHFGSGFTHLPRLRNLVVTLSLNFSRLFRASAGAFAAFDDPPSTCLAIFFSAASLREIVLESNHTCHLLRRTLNLVPLGSNITTLSIRSCIDTPLAHRILRELQHLEHCHIVSCRSLPNHDHIVPSIYLPSLQTLSVCGRALEDIQHLCKPLETPSLSKLHLYVYITAVLQVFSLNSSTTSITAFPGQPTTGALAGPPSSTQGLNYRVDVPYPPPSTERFTAFLVQCTSLRTLVINPRSSGISGAEVQAIFSSVPQIRSLVFDSNIDADMGSFEYNQTPAAAELASTKYSLHPLLRQERVVSVRTGDPGAIRLERPLLPNLTTFTWNELSSSIMQIPNDFLVSFIKARLRRHTLPLDIDASPASSGFDLHPQGEAVAPLKDVQIRLLKERDTIDIEAEITLHAREVGLERGVDFNLDICAYRPAT